VREFKGSLAAEHGVGIARTEYMREQVGDQLLGVMREIKRMFDPKNLFNPGKLIGDGEFKIDAHFRSTYTLHPRCRSSRSSRSPSRIARLPAIWSSATAAAAAAKMRPRCARRS
jgi:hypothetical protein